jgi:hypothetical protein
MSEFNMFLGLGFEHIADSKGFDHILFIVALCAIYTYKDWKGVLWMVTAFTVGHSITLVLSTLEYVHLSQGVVDKLIPFTILLTCISNIFLSKGEEEIRKTANLKYGIALVFGLVHGLAFSGTLKSLLAFEDSILLQLFAFNLGLELGQVVIVLATLLLAFIFVNTIQVPKRWWNYVLSGGAGSLALLMIFDVI